MLAWTQEQRTWRSNARSANWMRRRTSPPQCWGAGAQPLPVTLEHAAAIEKLPWRHRDPFDRMLVAQALTENAAIVSGDEPLSEYGVAIVW
jgi:PIN domain nuclease of toxin-antitoxin system